MASTDFNPIKEEVGGKKAHAMIWSTKTLETALKGLEQGRKLIANPFYENNTRLLKSDLVFKRTPEEIEEFKKCMNDILYFANRYCQLMTPEGVKHIKLRDYQEKYLEQVSHNQMNIMLSARQAGKTTTSAIFMLHYMLFNTDKTALILGNKRVTSCDILSKLKSIFYELPYFLKPGVFKWNDGEVVLDNGCRVKAEATTENSGIGMTIHCCLMDEFAHVPPNILEKFYNNLLPVVTASRGKVLITSTIRDKNLFWRLWCAAKAGENDYVPFEVTWDMIPEWNPDKKCWEKRDEAWHRKQVANYGSEEAFNQQFGTSPEFNSSTLITTKVLKSSIKDSVLFVNKDLAINYGEYFFWEPDVVVEEIKNKPTCITIDIAEGIGGDYTTYTFNSLKMIDDKVHSEAYGYFHCNDKNVQECVQILKDFCIHYMDINNFVISLEYNLYGELFVKCMLEEIEKDTPNMMKFNEDVFLKYFNEERTRYTMGKKITAKSKLLGLSLFKNQYEHGVIVNKSAQFLNELTNFCDNKGNNTYQASYGHDDLVMSQMHIVFATENQRVKELAQMEMVQGRGYSAYNPYDMIRIPSTNLYDFNQFNSQNADLNAQRLNRFS